MLTIVNVCTGPVENEQSNGFFYQTCVSVAEYFRSSKTDLPRAAVSISPVLLPCNAQIEQITLKKNGNS